MFDLTSLLGGDSPSIRITFASTNWWWFNAVTLTVKIIYKQIRWKTYYLAWSSESPAIRCLNKTCWIILFKLKTNKKIIIAFPMTILKHQGVADGGEHVELYRLLSLTIVFIWVVIYRNNDNRLLWGTSKLNLKQFEILWLKFNIYLTKL